jgi:hypothetical protein
MAAPPRGPVLSGREEALAREVAAILRPVLAEMDRKLDAILQKADELLTRLDKDGIDALLARLEAAAGAAGRGGAREPGGGRR